MRAGTFVEHWGSPDLLGLPNQLGEGSHSAWRARVTATVDRMRAACFAENYLQNKDFAPVAQWIEQRFPKPRALVRFRPGASMGPRRDARVAFGFKFEWDGRSSKHFPFDWSGPDE